MAIQGVLGYITDNNTVLVFNILQRNGRLKFSTAGFCIGAFKQDTRRLAELVGTGTLLGLYENRGIIYNYRSRFQQTFKIRNRDLYG